MSAGLFSFGKKYCGNEISTVPSSYFEWCLGLSTLPPAIRAQIEEELARRTTLKTSQDSATAPGGDPLPDPLDVDDQQSHEAPAPPAFPDPDRLPAHLQGADDCLLFVRCAHCGGQNVIVGTVSTV